MKSLKSLILLFTCFVIVSCGADSGSDSFTAPSSISGKVYRMTVDSGAGFFATTGTYTLSFSSTQNTYVVTGDGVNVADSVGSYTFTTNGNLVIASIVDSSLGNGSFALTYSSATGGTFLATAASDAASNQSGRFVEL